MLSTKQIEVAVRLYQNEKYGTTYGKAKFRKAIYNAVIDTKDPKVKYIADFYTHEDWMNTAKSDGHMAVLEEIEPNVAKLYSWVSRYDPATKTKTTVDGFCAMNLDGLDLTILIVDEDAGVVDKWDLEGKPCKQQFENKQAPQILATNSDLSAW